MSVCFYFTSLATRRHETAHQFANRAGLYSGPNDANDFPVGTNFDHLRARDLGFELIPENHSEAFAAVIDVVPVEKQKFVALCFGSSSSINVSLNFSLLNNYLFCMN